TDSPSREAACDLASAGAAAQRANSAHRALRTPRALLAVRMSAARWLMASGLPAFGRTASGSRAFGWAAPWPAVVQEYREPARVRAGYQPAWSFCQIAQAGHSDGPQIAHSLESPGLSPE